MTLRVDHRRYCASTSRTTEIDTRICANLIVQRAANLLDSRRDCERSARGRRSVCHVAWIQVARAHGRRSRSRSLIGAAANGRTRRRRRRRTRIPRRPRTARAVAGVRRERVAARAAPEAPQRKPPARAPPERAPPDRAHAVQRPALARKHPARPGRARPQPGSARPRAGRPAAPVRAQPVPARLLERVPARRQQAAGERRAVHRARLLM